MLSGDFLSIESNLVTVEQYTYTSAHLPIVSMM